MWKTCVTLVLLICVHVCAHGPMHRRVAGGFAAKEKAWPWIVSLHDPTCHICGGSLISSEWVLSAAHCFIGDNWNIPAKSIRVYSGKMTQREKNKNEVFNEVQKIYTHNQYKVDTWDNDIALLHLSTPVNLKKRFVFKNKHIRPVPLAAKGSLFPDQTISMIIGWGDITPGENVPYPGALQEAEVLVVDHNQCKSDWTKALQGTSLVRVTNNMICAGGSGSGSVGAGTGSGDSGGPIMKEIPSQWVQFGITSWGHPDMMSLPAVYTDVSQYEQWIKDTIQATQSQNLPTFVVV